MWHPWSGWSTYNNKTNDYETYRGDRVSEYNVQSRTEYKYKKYNEKKVPVYCKKYYTEYVKWVWFVPFYHTVSSWESYPGSKSGYSINNRYTKYEIKYYNGGYDYTNWITNTSYYDWERIYSRESYRYRERTITWNPNTNQGTEYVPLNYSLYDRNEQPIGAGIKWHYGDIEEKYMTQKTRNATETLLDDKKPNERNLEIFQYYITSKDIKIEIRNNLINSLYHLQNEDLKIIIDTLSDELTDAGITWLAKKVGLSFLASIDIGIITYIKASAISNDSKELIIYLANINSNIENDKPLLLNFAYNTNRVILPYKKLRLTYEYNKDYVSLLYNYQFAFDNNLEYYIPNGAKAFGTISYLSENELKNEILNMINDYTWETYFLK